MTGREPRWNVDLLLDHARHTGQTVPDFVQDVKHRLEVAHEVARANLQRAASAAAEWHDRRVKTKNFCPGDKVRIYCPRRYKGRSVKWQSLYCQTGEIVQKINDSTYIVHTNKGHKIFHADKIKLIAE